MLLSSVGLASMRRIEPANVSAPLRLARRSPAPRDSPRSSGRGPGLPDRDTAGSAPRRQRHAAPPRSVSAPAPAPSMWRRVIRMAFPFIWHELVGDGRPSPATPYHRDGLDAVQDPPLLACLPATSPEGRRTGPPSNGNPPGPGSLNLTLPTVVLPCRIDKSQAGLRAKTIQLRAHRISSRH